MLHGFWGAVHSFIHSLTITPYTLLSPCCVPGSEGFVYVWERSFFSFMFQIVALMLLQLISLIKLILFNISEKWILFSSFSFTKESNLKADRILQISSFILGKIVSRHGTCSLILHCRGKELRYSTMETFVHISQVHLCWHICIFSYWRFSSF